MDKNSRSLKTEKVKSVEDKISKLKFSLNLVQIFSYLFYLIFLERSLKNHSLPILDKCCFHPGAPIFHDAYKGWSCCNKKSTDFTEFLNFKGCTSGKHSNEKPIEPEKKTEPEIDMPQPVERKPITPVSQRPDFESPCTKLEPIVNPSFKKQMDELDLNQKSVVGADGSVPIGTSCKQGGCKSSYESPASDDAICVFHPGVPIFHEGYKFWSCCQKKTSDFQTFLGQVGCETGKHKWIKEEQESVACRWDWHQTPSTVVVAVYCKNYDYKKSFVKVNPVRLIVKLIFPLQNNAEFNIDVELRGLIDVSKTSATMFGTKIEITMPKAESGHWLKLDFPRDTPKDESKSEQKPIDNGAGGDHLKPTEVKKIVEDNDSDVDLDDLELVQGAKIMELGELAKSCQLVEES